MTERVYRFVLGSAGLVLVIGAWLTLSWNSTDPYFPPLRNMVPAAIDYWSSESGIDSIVSTVRNLIIGLVIGIAAGVLMGLIIGQIESLDITLTPLIEFLRATPKTALLPVFVAMFGVGAEMKVFSIAFGITWLLLISTVDGLKSIPYQWRDTAKIYGLTPFQEQVGVVIPAVLPRILAGIHIAIPTSLIFAVTSELIGGSTGIGAVILNAQFTYEVDLMWSGILLLGIIGWIMATLFSFAQRRLNTWDTADEKLL
ncbi:ABC transporter permease [Pseudochelatococcus sp. B33]